jgi:hypothetical protein
MVWLGWDARARAPLKKRPDPFSPAEQLNSLTLPPASSSAAHTASMVEGGLVARLYVTLTTPGT